MIFPWLKTTKYEEAIEKKEEAEQKKYEKKKNTNAQCLPFVHTTLAQTDMTIIECVFSVCLFLFHRRLSIV